MFNWWAFGDLINSKACIHEYKLLNLSDLKKVAKTFFKNVIYQPASQQASQSASKPASQQKCWFSIGFIRKTWFRPTKCCQNHWFYNICKNKSSVAAAALTDRPSRCSHRWFIFANVVKPMVLATIVWSKSRFPYKTNGKSTFWLPKLLLNAPGCCWRMGEPIYDIGTKIILLFFFFFFVWLVNRVFEKGFVNLF